MVTDTDKKGPEEWKKKWIKKDSALFWKLFSENIFLLRLCLLSSFEWFKQFQRQSEEIRKCLTFVLCSSFIVLTLLKCYFCGEGLGRRRNTYLQLEGTFRFHHQDFEILMLLFLSSSDAFLLSSHKNNELAFSR